MARKGILHINQKSLKRSYNSLLHTNINIMKQRILLFLGVFLCLILGIKTQASTIDYCPEDNIEVCLEEYYSPVKIKNNTNQVVKGKVYYADTKGIGISFCKNDSYTIQPWGTWTKKRGSCLIKKITSKVGNKQVAAKSYTSSGTGYSTFQVTVAKRGGYAVHRTGKDWDKQVSDGFTKAYSGSVDLVNDAYKRSKNAANVVAKNSSAFAKQGINTTSKEFKDLSKKAEQQLSAGVEVLSDVAKDAYEWADRNACQIAVTATISIGVVAYFTPKPSPTDPGTVTSTSMSATALAYYAMKQTASKAAAMAKKKVASQTMAIVASESFMLIPGVKGNVDKDVLKNVIANSIYYSLDCVGCWGTPAGVGVAIAAAVAPLIAEYACSNIIPTGYNHAVAVVNTLPNVGNTASYKVEIDNCHSTVTNEGTGGRITVEFWSGAKRLESVSKNGVPLDCTNDATFIAKTKLPVTHVVVKTNSGDAFFIDEIRLYKGGILNKKFGSDNGQGWCLSTQSSDANGSWARAVVNSTCKSAWQFDYGVPKLPTEYKVAIDACHTSLSNEGTKNKISVEYWSGNQLVGTKTKKGVPANCSKSDETFFLMSTQNITHIFVKTNGSDGFYIDEIRLYKGGKLQKHHGRDNGGGWCLSKDAKDGKTWRKKRALSGDCKSSVRFNY